MKIQTITPFLVERSLLVREYTARRDQGEDRSAAQEAVATVPSGFVR